MRIRRDLRSNLGAFLRDALFVGRDIREVWDLVRVRCAIDRDRMHTKEISEVFETLTRTPVSNFLSAYWQLRYILLGESSRTKLQSDLISSILMDF